MTNIKKKKSAKLYHSQKPTNMNILGINVTREIKDLFSENFKTSKKMERSSMLIDC